MTALHAGWYLVAYTADVPQGIAPLAVGDRRLMTVRDGGRIRVLDATCPHRGASLAHGGVLLHGSCVRCPFHGRQIALGDASRPYHVREYDAVHADGMLFATFSAGSVDDNGFRSRIEALARERTFVKVIEEEVAVPPEIVAENGFDPEHFEWLHRMPGMGDFTLDPCEPGRLQVRGRMNGTSGELFVATAYSPTVVVAELRFAERTQVVITGSVPTSTGCVARIGYAIRRQDGDLWRRWAVGTRLGFAQDQLIWNHLDATVTPLFGERDTVLAAFGDYCKAFPGLPR
jgi:3-ketosteroid 9alpha-monooxygenase subunit A